MSGFLATFRIDYGGVREVKFSDKNGGQTTTVNIVIDGDEEGLDEMLEDNKALPVYMVYFMGGIILLVIFVFICWYCARKRMMIRVREKVHNLRLKARPDNLVRDDIKGNIKQIKFRPNKENKQEGEPCAICTDEFKINERISVTECNHLYHD